MPFSPEIRENVKNKINKIVTLQVRILYRKLCVKKVSPFASASMTLEAALVLSLFIFAAVSLMLPMKILITDRKIQAGLESVGEELSKYAYIYDAMENGKYSEIPGADDFAKGFCENFGSGVAAGYVLAKTMTYSDTAQLHGVDITQSRILEDGETIDLILEYQIRMPFPVLGIGDIKRTVRCTRRGWVGKDGKDDGSGDGTGDEDNQIVYIGKGSTRYHVSSTCHYLYNNLTSVSLGQIDTKRNESGGKYHPCAVCGKGASGASTVFIMPNGSSYHTSKNCRAIIAYVQAIELSKVKHLGACSYCGR